MVDIDIPIKGHFQNAGQPRWAKLRLRREAGIQLRNWRRGDRSHSTLANSILATLNLLDFGQFEFGQTLVQAVVQIFAVAPDVRRFAQNFVVVPHFRRLRNFWRLPIPSSTPRHATQCFWVVRPPRTPPSPGPPSAGPPKISLFFHLPPQFSFFSPSLGGLLVEFWWCFRRPNFGRSGWAVQGKGSPPGGLPTQHTEVTTTMTQNREGEVGGGDNFQTNSLFEMV